MERAWHISAAMGARRRLAAEVAVSDDFIAEVTHSGDKHCEFLIQAVSCSMAQAAYVAMVNQAKKDLATESDAAITQEH